MSRIKIGMIAVAAVLVLGAAGLLHAQARSGMMGGMMGMVESCPMMSAHADGPAAILEREEALELSESQIEHLRGIEQRVAQQREGAMTRMAEIHDRLEAASGGERFDEAAVRSALEQMGALHTEMAVGMLRARHEARNVLTLAQRTELSELGRGGMQGMMDGHGTGAAHGMGAMMDMMQGCPMMNGGSRSEGGA